MAVTSNTNRVTQTRVSYAVPCVILGVREILQALFISMQNRVHGRLLRVRHRDIMQSSVDTGFLVPPCSLGLIWCYQALCPPYIIVI